MFQIVNVQIGLRLSQLRFRSVLVIPLLFATTAFAQRITTINNKGTKHISGNIVTEAATAPTTPTPIEGDIWINSTTNTTKFWGGDSWEPIAAARAFALIDNDGDTRITVEENADEDVIRFYLGDDPGVTAAEYFRMRGPRLEVVNSGNSVFVGEGAGANDDLSINQNVFIGYQTGRANITGNQNVATGYQTLNSNTTGAGNTSMGYNSLSTNVAGNNGVAIG